MHKLLENNKIRVADNKIVVLDVAEVEKQTNVYRSIQKREKSRMDAQSAH
jgi:hypothetical protein